MTNEDLSLADGQAIKQLFVWQREEDVPEHRNSKGRPGGKF